MSIMRNRAVLASVGVATATVTTFAGFAPAVTVAGAEDGDDASNLTQAEPGTDGTYESCSAYFGYGKSEGGLALGLTTFPVSVEGGTPSGEAPTVENDEIDVVLVLTDTDGVELVRARGGHRGGVGRDLGGRAVHHAGVPRGGSLRVPRRRL